MDDLFKRTQAELHHGRGDFLTAELAICSRYAHLASTMYMAGKSSFADRQITGAEESYATAHRFLTDPKNRTGSRPPPWSQSRNLRTNRKSYPWPTNSGKPGAVRMEHQRTIGSGR